LVVVDIGAGIARTGNEEGHNIPADSIDSVPLRALLRGLTAPNSWTTDAVALDFSDFISSATRSPLFEDRMAYSGNNLAVISREYMNLSLRLGYHFNVVDAYVSENIEDNYVYFRFVGGVTEEQRKHRRALVIQSILEADGFRVSVQGDLVIARLDNRLQSDLTTTLERIGKLIGFTRQLDARLRGDDSIAYYTELFSRLDSV
jgi:pyruvate,water dikinase